MLIRECRQADVDVVEEALPTDGMNVHAYWLARQSAGEITYLVAFVDARPVGSCVIRWAGDRDPQIRGALPDCPVITNLHVDPTHRGGGVGTALIRFAEATIQGRGYLRVTMGVGEDNARALALYTRLGYRDSGLRCVSRYLNVGQCSGLQAGGEDLSWPSGRPVVLFDVLAEHRQWCASEGSGEVGGGSQPVGPVVVPGQRGELLPYAPGWHAFEGVTSRDKCGLGWGS